jgi:uncharacterized protein YdhG (YjbR/CyaY superfamily)
MEDEMSAARSKPASIDDYIAGFPPQIRRRLLEMRAIIRNHAPMAEEKISYQMPTFYLEGNLVHFAAFKAHIGFYPTASGIAAFEDRLSSYNHSKGAVQFPLERPLPVKLIGQIVRYRVRQNTMGNVTRALRLGARKSKGRRKKT